MAESEPIFQISPALYEKLVAFQAALETPAPSTNNLCTHSPGQENYEHPPITSSQQVGFETADHRDLDHHSRHPHLGTTDDNSTITAN